MGHPAHRAGRRRRRTGQPRGVQRHRARPPAIRRHRQRVRRGPGRDGRPGRGRLCRTPPLRRPDDRHRLPAPQHRGPVRCLRAGPRRPRPRGHLGGRHP
ncbi:hypothetical protein NOS12_001379 [Streptomyces murinus]